MGTSVSMVVWTLAQMMGCSGNPVELSTPDPGTTEEQFPPAAPDFGTQLSVGGRWLQPGEEIEMCYYINVGNDAPVWVSEIELAAAPGLHHSIVSRIPEERPNSHSECFGFPSDLGNQIPLPLFATSTQVDRGSTALPEGVGFELQARQQLIVNYHYLNATTEPIKPKVYLNLHYANPEEIRSRAGFYAFTNAGDIAVPPHGKQRITMACPFTEPALLATTTPHMHELGTYFGVNRWTENGIGELLHEASGWYDPETRAFEPPPLIADGEGLAFTCEWESDKDTTTYFGESSDHEMCFAFGFFYPATMDMIGLDGFGCEVIENVITPGP